MMKNVLIFVTAGTALLRQTLTLAMWMLRQEPHLYPEDMMQNIVVLRLPCPTARAVSTGTCERLCLRLGGSALQRSTMRESDVSMYEIWG
jgi:hypothetical protein